MINLGYDFERRIEDMVRNRINANSIKPLTLGGVAGPSGGVGSPIGSFIGQLSQVYITYDTTEAAIDTPSPLPSGVSLVTNLNKIRYDISQIDSRVTVIEETNFVETFLDLSDTPTSFTGKGYNVLAVNSGETAIVFVSGVTQEVQVYHPTNSGIRTLVFSGGLFMGYYD